MDLLNLFIILILDTLILRTYPLVFIVLYTLPAFDLFGTPLAARGLGRYVERTHASERTRPRREETLDTGWAKGARVLSTPYPPFLSMRKK